MSIPSTKSLHRFSGTPAPTSLMYNHNNHIEIHYRKIQPLDVNCLAKQYEPSEDDIANNYNPFYLSEIQSFNPIYTDFFLLKESNYNRIGLNHEYYFDGSFIRSSTGLLKEQPSYYVKCSPILDPIHYLVGKYQTAKNIHVLPTLGNQSECFAKIADKHNASYVDGFFSYLSSKLKYKHNMLNAIDFYGSYLAIQKVFKVNVTDDLEYLHQSKYFIDNIGKGFTICCGSESTFDDFTGIGSRANKKRLVLEEEIPIDELFGMEVLEINEQIVGDPSTVADISCEYEKPEKDDQSTTSSSDQCDTSDNNSSSHSEKEDDTFCQSGGVSPENSRKSSSPRRSGIERLSGETKYEFRTENAQSDNESCPEEEEEEPQSEYESESESESEESFDQEAYAYVENFPTNLIFLEKCADTLDNLFLNNEVDETNGAAYLMQIIMSLIAFQKAFHFTHNDLHTNNIMYIHTDIEFLYYKYNNTFYRVPTYGKIFKIIDFGRAIYKFKDNIFCSDSFAPKGDAHSQYNTEPYFNHNKPRLEPNMSFDLCRLGTSIYDFIIQEEEEPRDQFQETIYRWCLDDNGKNIMYRRNGEERYPGFKLYKMIARNVHAHTPHDQLKYPIFQQFLMNPLDAAKLDESEVRRYGLNIDLVEREYI